MSYLHLISIGKLKAPFDQAEENYLKRMGRLAPKIHQLRASSDKMDQEGSAVLKKLKDISRQQHFRLVLLMEEGKQWKSTDFGRWLFDGDDKMVVFVMGGAYGHHSSVLALPHQKLSLSALTLPHQLARIVLVEQLYRAFTLREGHPYHNE